jgi:hypothetical protein
MVLMVVQPIFMSAVLLFIVEVKKFQFEVAFIGGVLPRSRVHAHTHTHTHTVIS